MGNWGIFALIFAILMFVVAAAAYLWPRSRAGVSSQGANSPAISASSTGTFSPPAVGVTYGSNSPVTFNIGDPPDVRRGIMNMKTTDVLTEIAGRYSKGCVILGVRGAKPILIESKLPNGTKIVADWDKATFKVGADGRAVMAIPDFGVTGEELIRQGERIFKNGVYLNFPLAQGHKPMHVPGIAPGPKMTLEIIDVEKLVFLLGFGDRAE